MFVYGILCPCVFFPPGNFFQRYFEYFLIGYNIFKKPPQYLKAHQHSACALCLVCAIKLSG